VLSDGYYGRDNNVGQHFLPVLRSLGLELDVLVAAAIADGSFALLLRVDNLTEASNANAPGVLYLARRVGEGRYAIDASSLEDGATIARPRLRFAGFVAAPYWATTFEPRVLPIVLPLGNSRIAVDFVLGALALRTDGSNGTIAGAFPVDELVTVASAITCAGDATGDQVISTVRQIPDLVLGAPNLQDTTKTCDAISFGFGFTARPIPPQDDAEVTTIPLAPPPCPADAGADSVADASAD
jgi:hypothetical protein